MSQEKVDRYKKEKANRKQLMKKQKREKLLWKIGACAVLVALVGWVGYSAFDRFYEPPVRYFDADVSAIDNYLNDLSAEIETEDEAGSEDGTETDTEAGSEDGNETDTEAVTEDETETDTEAGSEDETEAETETEEVSEKGTKTVTEKAAEETAKDGTEAETDFETEAGSEDESESEK